MNLIFCPVASKKAKDSQSEEILCFSIYVVIVATPPRNTHMQEHRQNEKIQGLKHFRHALVNPECAYRLH